MTWTNTNKKWCFKKLFYTWILSNLTFLHFTDEWILKGVSLQVKMGLQEYDLEPMRSGATNNMMQINEDNIEQLSKASSSSSSNSSFGQRKKWSLHKNNGVSPCDHYSGIYRWFLFWNEWNEAYRIHSHHTRCIQTISDAWVHTIEGAFTP